MSEVRTTTFTRGPVSYERPRWTRVSVIVGVFAAPTRLAGSVDLVFGSAANLTDLTPQAPLPILVMAPRLTA